MKSLSKTGLLLVALLFLFASGSAFGIGVEDGIEQQLAGGSFSLFIFYKQAP